MPGFSLLLTMFCRKSLQKKKKKEKTEERDRQTDTERGRVCVKWLMGGSVAGLSCQFLVGICHGYFAFITKSMVLTVAYDVGRSINLTPFAKADAR